MTILGSQVGPITINIKRCNIVIKKRSRCRGFEGAQLLGMRDVQGAAPPRVYSVGPGQRFLGGLKYSVNSSEAKVR